MNDNLRTVDSTAFMSGQVLSKIWLCEKLEAVLHREFAHEVDIWLLGGWYGMTSFLLQSRGIAPIHHIHSFDIDPQVRDIAFMLNETYQYKGKFQAETQDVNTLDYSVPPHVIINTSTEHMDSNAWFQRIPAGVLCVLQSNNMPHDDHVHHCDTVDDLVEQFPLSRSLYRGTKSIQYPTWSFNRFMHIGYK